jgi:HD-GYP domain-containing protein (c-di-GMP phosphodiesterase class II)
MLEVLGEALGLKTHEIEGPSKRVTVFTICIARAMGLSRELHEIPFLADAAEIVYSHHERCDGAGYPRGFSLPDNVWSDLTKEIQSEASMRMQSPLPTM